MGLDWQIIIKIIFYSFQTEQKKVAVISRPILEFPDHQELWCISRTDQVSASTSTKSSLRSLQQARSLGWARSPASLFCPCCVHTSIFSPHPLDTCMNEEIDK